MEFKINIPFSSWDYKISAVYKITFNTGHFYIGCSKNLRSRASSWESIIVEKRATNITNTNIIEQTKLATSATLDIIELCSIKDLNDREAFYLHKFKDDIMMISNEYCSWKPILQYKIDGMFIKKHVSISAAARYINTRVGKIQDVINGRRNSYKGMKFFYELDYQKPIRKDFRFKRVRKMGRNVLVCDLDGNIIQSCKKIKDAAEYVNGNTSMIARTIAGIQKTHKGFIFKYA